LNRSSRGDHGVRKKIILLGGRVFVKASGRIVIKRGGDQETDENAKSGKRGNL